MTEVAKSFIYNQNFIPVGLSAPGSELFTDIKSRSLTHCRLNELPYMIRRKILISILG